MNVIDTMKQALELANDIMRGKYKGNAAEIGDSLRLAIEQAEKQEPVTAQHRFRHPQKTMPNWSAWQPTKVANRPPWEIDSQGYEVEYRNLYTTPPQRQPLAPTVPADANINQRLSFKAGWRAAEAAHGIGGEA